MYIDKTDPHARQLVPLDKEKEFIQSYNWSHREGMKKGKEFVSVLDVTTGQLTDYNKDGRSPVRRGAILQDGGCPAEGG